MMKSSSHYMHYCVSEDARARNDALLAASNAEAVMMMLLYIKSIISI